MGMSPGITVSKLRSSSRNSGINESFGVPSCIFEPSREPCGRCCPAGFLPSTERGLAAEKVYCSHGLPALKFSPARGNTLIRRILFIDRMAPSPRLGINTKRRRVTPLARMSSAIPVPADAQAPTNLPSNKPMNRTRKKLMKHWQFYLLVFFPLVYIILFKYVPMFGVLIAFKEYNVVQGYSAVPG